MREDRAYQAKPSLMGFLKVCEGLIVEWQQAQNNKSVRGGGNRKDGHQESDRDKKQRADYTAPAMGKLATKSDKKRRKVTKNDKK